MSSIICRNTCHDSSRSALSESFFLNTTTNCSNLKGFEQCMGMSGRPSRAHTVFSACSMIVERNRRQGAAVRATCSLQPCLRRWSRAPWQFDQIFPTHLQACRTFLLNLGLASLSTVQPAQSSLVTSPRILRFARTITTQNRCEFAVSYIHMTWGVTSKVLNLYLRHTRTNVLQSTCEKVQALSDRSAYLRACFGISYKIIFFRYRTVT